MLLGWQAQSTLLFDLNSYINLNNLHKILQWEKTDKKRLSRYNPK